MKLFLAYMLDGIMQVRSNIYTLPTLQMLTHLQSAIIYFIILYTYAVPTSRSDGYDVAQYEFSTVMVIAAVLTANLFNGLNTNVWTGWVFFAVAIGNVLVWIYTVSECLERARDGRNLSVFQGYL